MTIILLSHSPLIYKNLSSIPKEEDIKTRPLVRNSSYFRIYLF